MKIKDKKLWDFLVELEKAGNLKPMLYYMYKTGVSSESSVVAEDEARGFNTSLMPDQNQSVVVNMVDMIIHRAVLAIGISRDNKTAVMCEIEYENKKLCVYFSTFDFKRTVCTSIRSEFEGMAVPLVD